jgi:putative FmdB family regulatory protein
MPLYDYHCNECRQVTEVLVHRSADAGKPPRCPHCGSPRMLKLVSIVNFKIATKSAYSDDFMHRALPFLRQQPETAHRFAEGKGSDDARAFQIAEHIGQEIDQRLEKEVLRKLPGS